MTDNNFWGAALSPVPPKPEEPAIPEDFSGLTMEEYAAYREGRVKDFSVVRGVEQADNPVERGRKIAQMFATKTAHGQFAEQYAEERQAAGVKQASDIFGAEAPSPRRNETPYGPALRRN